MENLRLARFIKYIKHQRCFRLLPIIGVVGGPMLVLRWILSQYDIFERLLIEMAVIKFLCLALLVECLIGIACWLYSLWDNGYL